MATKKATKPSATKPHDSLFQIGMKLPGSVQAFLEHLPQVFTEKVVPQSFKSQECHFISPQMRHLYTDCLFTGRLRKGGRAYLYLLCEHLSQADPWLPYRIAEYCIAIWKRALRNAKKPLKNLPFIFPVLIYNGPKRYTGATELESLVPTPEGLAEYSMRQKTFVISLCEISDASLSKSAQLGVSLIALKHAYDTMPYELICVLLKKLPEAQQKPSIEAFLTYIITVRERRAPDEIDALDTHFRQFGVNTMTIAEEWKLEGIEIGTVQGIEKGILKTVTQFVKAGLSLEFIHEQTGISMERLCQLRHDVLTNEPFTEPKNISE